MEQSDLFQEKNLAEVGERYIKRRIIERLGRYPLILGSLLGGLGHDSGFVRAQLERDDVLLVNTDKSGPSKAFNLGLANGECIGDFAVSHAVSDILASGGRPFAISVAMLLPGQTKVRLVDQIVAGIGAACMNYEMNLAGGDTKKAESLSLIVTALGKAPEKNVLYRNAAQVGDKLVVSGYLGSVLLGSIIHKRSIAVHQSVLDVVNHSLIYQRPPYRLALEMNSQRLASSCTDISDGLPAACKNLVERNNLGVIIKEDSVPIHPSLKDVSETLGISPIQLSMAGGDWRFLYSVSEQNLEKIWSISARSQTQLTVIGEVVEQEGIWLKVQNGSMRRISDIEHDSFISYEGGKSYFEYLSDPIEIFQ